MESLRELIQRKFWQIAKVFTHSKPELGFHKLRNFHSEFLKRDVKINIYLPPSYNKSLTTRYPVLLFNDGQDMEAVKLAETLLNLYEKTMIQEIIVVAIHAGERMHEYGTAAGADYKMRGAKAIYYAQFVTKELLPYIWASYRCLTGPRYTSFAGFSLGGLSAMDIVWNHAEIFGKVGVFSGSFWWRYVAYTPENPDGHRIMHDIIQRSSYKPNMKFWLQTGTKDETSDRNGNGIIDSIDDTMDIIKELEVKGYKRPDDIEYVEVVDGEHNQKTWGEVLPKFLLWGFNKK